MTWPPRSANGSDSAVLWLACAIAACTGAYTVFGVLGAAIDRQANSTGAIAERMQADARTLAQRPRLEWDERVLAQRRYALGLQADKPVLVARFIRSAEAIGAAQHVEIEHLEERPAAATAGSDDPIARRAEFAVDSIPLDVSLRGTYRDLLAAIRALARVPLALRIDITALVRNSEAGPPAADFPLTAQLRVVIEHLDDGQPMRRAAHPRPEDIPNHARPI